MELSWRLIFSSRSSIDLGISSSRWHRTCRRTPSGSSLRRLGWLISRFWSKYRRGLHYQWPCLKYEYKFLKTIRYLFIIIPPKKIFYKILRIKKIRLHSSAFSTNWWTDKVALYGSTTVSDTFGDGTMEKVSMILSGYSSLTLEINKVPIPEPVPPPKEWVI